MCADYARLYEGLPVGSSDAEISIVTARIDNIESALVGNLSLASIDIESTSLITSILVVDSMTASTMGVGDIAASTATFTSDLDATSIDASILVVDSITASTITTGDTIASTAVIGNIAASTGTFTSDLDATSIDSSILVVDSITASTATFTAQVIVTSVDVSHVTIDSMTASTITTGDLIASTAVIGDLNASTIAQASFTGDVVIGGSLTTEGATVLSELTACALIDANSINASMITTDSLAASTISVVGDIDFNNAADITNLVNASMIGTITLGTNTISDGSLTGNWAFTSDEVIMSSHLTVSATTYTASLVCSGTVTGITDISASSLTTTGSITDGTATLDGSGAWTGITSLAMGGAISGVTTLAATGIASFGPTARTDAAFNITTIKNVLSDTNDTVSYTLSLSNPANDNGEAVGISFGVSAGSDALGAAIYHTRTGSDSYGPLTFATKPNGGSITTALVLGSDQSATFAGSITDGTMTIDGSGAISGVTTLAGTGAISGFTDYSASGSIALGDALLSWHATREVVQVYGSSFVGVATQTEILENAYLHTGGTYKYIANDEATAIRMTAGGLVIRTAASGTAGNDIIFSDKFTLAQGGDLTLAGAISTGKELVVNDGGSASTTILRVRMDDQNVDGLEVGNDTYSSTINQGLRFQITNAGLATISAPDDGASPGTLTLKTDNTTALTIGTDQSATFASTVTVGAYTLPATDGTNGQVLVTNGSGVLTWTTP